jgi:hypothetical protein
MRPKGAENRHEGEEWVAVARVKVCALSALCALRGAENRHEGENGSRLRTKERFQWKRKESRQGPKGRTTLVIDVRAKARTLQTKNVPGAKALIVFNPLRPD